MDLPSVHIYANCKIINQRNQENNRQEISNSKDQIELIFLLSERQNNMKFKIDTELSRVHTYGICNTGNQENQDILRQEIPNSKDQIKPPIYFLLSESQNKIQIEIDTDMPSVHT